MLYPKTHLSPLFNRLRPATQTFTIKGDRDTLLIGQNGTTITILKNTFVNSQGQAATIVNIDLVEVNSIADIIKTNLHTVSGDKILRTGGMFFIDAKENNKSLAVAEAKSIYVEVKSNYKDPQMKIFDGKFDNKGTIDWTATGNLENNLIPIPLSLMNFHKCDFECGFSKKQTDHLSNPKFENTYIATREFEDRCCAMKYATCPQSNNLSQKFLDIYTSNINKPLFYSDSLVIDYLTKNLKDKIDTTKKFDWNDTGWFTYMFQFFIELKKQRLTNTINYEKLGITESTTTEDLISRGYSEREAEKIIAFYRLRKQLIRIREVETKSTQLATYSFSINKLGWVNCDRLLKVESDDEIQFTTNILTKDTLDFISVSLVIPRYNVYVFSVNNGNNQYVFTKSNGEYIELPIGEDAIIVAFSYKGNKPYFGKQKIKIPKTGKFNIELMASTESIIKQDINKLTE